MMLPIIDHIHITVTNLKRAEKFYDELLSILGFDISLKEFDSIPEHDYEIIEYHHSCLSIGIVSQRKEYVDDKVSRRRAGSLHHLAFQAKSQDEVDSIYEQVKAIGATIIHKPQYYLEYCSDYYAFFFKDSEGIEYEIVSFARQHYFSKE